ncbi:MAG: hypothetical protein IT204_07610 [Fimbriimonadaceae bacterium]|nr:hypothetical protein [Fimbriimonadaceae bacterium]
MKAAGLLLLLTLRGAVADDLALLRLALTAETKVARRGTQTVQVQPANTLVSSSVDFACDGQGHSRREHRTGPSAGLVVLSAAPWEYRRQGSSGSWFRQPLTAGALNDLTLASRIATNYTLSSAAGPTLAGRPTTRLNLTPKRSGNPRRRLWLDRASGLVLQSETDNRDGQFIARTRYEAITFGPVDAAQVRLPADAAVDRSTPPTALVRYDSVAAAEARLGHRIDLPSTPPAGYKLAEVYLRACRQGGWTPVTTWSDGVNRLTLMATSGRGQSRGRGWRWGQRRQCEVQPSRLQLVVRLAHGPGEAVLVGDLARAQLETMLRSLP